MGKGKRSKNRQPKRRKRKKRDLKENPKKFRGLSLSLSR
jgi:hypothetical protein